VTVLTALTCLFAAYVTAQPATDVTNIIRVRTEPKCHVEAAIIQGTLMLQHQNARVEINIPTDGDWYRVRYQWGDRVALVDKEDWQPHPVVIVKGRPARR